MWSFSSLPKYTAQNVKWVVIHRHHTCYPSFLCKSSSYKSRACRWHGDWHKCLLSFHSVYEQELELSSSEQWWESTHPKAWGTPAKDMVPTVLLITNAASWQIVTGNYVSWRKTAEASRDTCDCLQLRCVLVCLDAVDIHKAEMPVCWSCSSDIRPTRTVSLPIYWMKQWKMLLWYESSESLVSVALFHRLHWSVISF